MFSPPPATRPAPSFWWLASQQPPYWSTCSSERPAVPSVTTRGMGKAGTTVIRPTIIHFSVIVLCVCVCVCVCPSLCLCLSVSVSVCLSLLNVQSQWYATALTRYRLASPSKCPPTAWADYCGVYIHCSFDQTAYYVHRYHLLSWKDQDQNVTYL